MTIGNFSEVVGKEQADNLIGSDLYILYGLAGNDILTTTPGTQLGGLATTIAVGGSGDNRYQIGNNSTTIIVENGGSNNDVGQANGIGFFSDTSFSLEIDNGRHLFVGDIESNQYAFLIDWQDPENRIETFELEDGPVSYQEVVDNFRFLPGYLGSVTWEEAIAQENLEEDLDLARLGLAAATIDETIAIVNTRAAVLESDDIRDDNLIDLYRFRNTNITTGSYIFVGEQERNDILANPNLNQIFSLDGVTEDRTLNSAFVASDEPGDDLLPLYRFQSLVTPGTYVFVGEEERNVVIRDFSDSFIEEGLAFYVYGAGSNLGIPFNRFQNNQNNTFLYAGPGETAAINGDPSLSSIFEDQGVAFEGFDLI